MEKTEKSSKKEKKGKGTNQRISVLQSILAGVVLMVIVILICKIVVWETKIYVCDEVQLKVEDATKACAYRFEKKLSEYEQMVQVMVSCLPDNQEVLNMENLKALNVLKETEYVHSAYLVDTSGKALNNKGEIVDLKDNQFVQDTLEEGEGGYSQLTYGINGEKAVIFVGLPVLDDNQVLTGIGMVAVKASVFSEDISESKAMGKGICMLMDEEGVVADSYNGQISKLKEIENLLSYLEDAKYTGKEGYTRILNEIAIKKTNQQKFEKDGQEYYITYTPVKKIDGYFVSIYEYDYIYGVVNKIDRNSNYMVAIIAGLFLMFFITLFVINRIAEKQAESQNRRLEARAEIDALTTLYNKAATEKYIRSYLENEGKYARSLLFIVDVDKFKTINDTKGHAFGDIVLSTIGRRISSEFRATDIIGRIGGDEFLIFLKHIPDHEIEVKEAEKIVKFFRELEPGDYVKTKVTASIGGAVYPDDAEDFETLFKAADEAVYKTKERGRDGYSFYREDVNN